MKKSLLSLGLLVLGMNMSIAQAPTVEVNVSPIETGVAIRINGEDLPPAAVMINGSVLVPLRAIAHELGAVVAYDSRTNSMLVSSAETAIALSVGRRAATINGEVVRLDAPVTVLAGQSYVPVRFIAEAFDARVRWDGGSRTVSIQT
jgi:hypothetical protein